MTAIRAGNAYADALFDLASEQKNLAEEIAPALQALAGALAGDKNWQRLMRDPLCAPHRATIIRALVETLTLPPLLGQFLILTAERGEALLALPAIAERFTARLDAAKGRVKVEALRAGRGSPEQEKILAELAGRFFGSGAELVWRDAPSLLGGFVLQGGGLKLDASLAGRLKNLEHALSA